MTISILNDALQIKEETPDKLQEYLHSINLTIFDPIFHVSANLVEAKQKVLFILCGYSEESPLVILRQDSKIEKEGICEYLQIPDFLRRSLMELSETEVRIATTQYLTQFAGPLFKALKLIDIQLEDLNLAITNKQYYLKDGEVIDLYDYKAHAGAVTQYEMLAKRKRLIEREISAQVKQLSGVEDLSNFARAGKESGRIKTERRGNVEKYIK